MNPSLINSTKYNYILLIGRHREVFPNVNFQNFDTMNNKVARFGWLGTRVVRLVSVVWVVRLVRAIRIKAQSDFMSNSMSFKELGRKNTSQL